MSIVNITLYNAAIAGCLAGSQAQRLQLFNAGGTDPVEPSDFSSSVTNAKLFAAEVDAVLQTVVSPPANIALLVSGGSTVVPSTAAEANASQSLPSAMVGFCKAAWSGRTFPPLDSSGTPYTQAEYNAVANTVVSLFVEYAANTDNS
jgi:hypothetical protein